MRREIAQLLQTGQEATARIRVEHIIREQNIMDAYEIVELFSELVAVRLPIIESQKLVTRTSSTSFYIRLFCCELKHLLCMLRTTILIFNQLFANVLGMHSVSQ